MEDEKQRPMKKTTIDCEKMVRNIRDSLYLETKDMTHDELIAFYNRPTRPDESTSDQKRKTKAE